MTHHEQTRSVLWTSGCAHLAALPWGLLLVAVLLVGQSTAQQVGPTDACRHTRANLQGIARAPVVVGLTPVIVIAKNPMVCKAILYNKSTTNMVNCAAVSDGDPTATAGYPIRAGAAMRVDLAAQDGVKCIRETSATANVEIAVLELFQ